MFITKPTLKSDLASCSSIPDNL